jgi:ketosteroid isomerase-like protein
MSEENVAAARRIYEARNRGDVNAVIAECHPEVGWHPHLSSLGGEPVRGHAGVREYLASLGNEWEEFRQEPEEFFDAGDQVVVFLQTHARGRRSGVRLEVPVAHVLTFEHGKCVRSVTHMDRAKGLESAGLR